MKISICFIYPLNFFLKLKIFLSRLKRFWQSAIEMFVQIFESVCLYISLFNSFILFLLNSIFVRLLFFIFLYLNNFIYHENLFMLLVFLKKFSMFFLCWGSNFIGFVFICKWIVEYVNIYWGFCNLLKVFWGILLNFYV